MTVDEGTNAGNSFLIAVIDSGIDYYVNATGYKIHHPDVADNVFGGATFRWDGYQVIITPNVYRDEGIYAGHGTHVAGTTAAVDNDLGVIGVAPKAYLYVLKLVTWDYRELVAAINYAVNIATNIIVISIGIYQDFPELRNACDNAYNGGRLLIAAAGDYESGIAYPANYSSVIAVGAVYPNCTRCEWSSTGNQLEFVAPGVNINSTHLNEGYALKKGTSFANPHVAAVAALIWSSKVDPDYDSDADGSWDNTEVRQKLRHLALDLSPAGRDIEYGYDLINGWAPLQRPLGDVNNDLKVDMRDVAVCARTINTVSGDPLWDPRADINIDNKVNMKDQAIISRNFGKVDP